MGKQTDRQKTIVARVMHAFKSGELEQRNGKLVENPKQAIALTLSEAGSSRGKSPGQNRNALRRTASKPHGPGEGKSRDAPTRKRGGATSRAARR